MQFREMSLEIHFRFRFRNTDWGWRDVILDAGFWELIDVKGADALREMHDKMGQRHSRHRQLDGHGRPQPLGTDPIYFVWQKYKELPFGPLNLPPG